MMYSVAKAHGLTEPQQTLYISVLHNYVNLNSRLYFLRTD